LAREPPEGQGEPVATKYSTAAGGEKERMRREGPDITDLLHAGVHILWNSWSERDISVTIRADNGSQLSTATVGNVSVSQFSAVEALREAIIQACAADVRGRNADDYGFKPTITIGDVPHAVDGKPIPAESAR
jgi:hypothetical protein